MSTVSPKPQLSNQATPASAEGASLIQQMASFNAMVPAVGGSLAAVDAASPSRPQVPVGGAPSLAGAAAVVTPAPPHHWRLPGNDVRDGDAPLREGTASSAEAAAVDAVPPSGPQAPFAGGAPSVAGTSAGVTPHHWRLPQDGVQRGAALPREGTASSAAVDAVPPSGPQAPFGGAPSSLAGVSAGVMTAQPHHWRLPDNNVRRAAALPWEGAASSAEAAMGSIDAVPPQSPFVGATSLAGSAASVTPVPSTSDRRLLDKDVRRGPTPPPEGKASSAEAATGGMNPPLNWRPQFNYIRPETAPGSGGKQWNLPSKVLSVEDGPPQDGCICLFDESAAIPPGMCTPMVVFLGPLFPSMHQRQGMEETKRKYVYNLIRRGHGHEDVLQKLSAYLACIDAKECEIRQRYDPSQCCWVTPQELVEMMVLDGLFIIEVLINNWLGKIDKGSASPQVKADTVLPEKGSSDYRPPLASTMVPQALREDFTPLKVRWDPRVLRFDLVVVANQIPFFVLEELFQMTEIPELGGSLKKSSTLKEIILDYIIGNAGDALAGYKGPVYHILHLVHLHLTFSKEEPQVSALLPNAPITRPSMARRALDKLKQKGMDLRALYKRTFSRSANIPVGWKDWKVIPPLRELIRVGVRLKPEVTYRFAEVKFKNGTLQVPAFAWRRYHIRLLTNLVVLEMSGWWPPEQRLFCSYVMFMAELIMKKEDAVLLFKKGILQQNNVDDVEKSLICPLLILADLSHGSKYECRFAGLVDDMVKCYQRWSKVGTAARGTKKLMAPK